MQDLAYIHVHTNKNLDGHCKWSRHIGSKSFKDQKTSHIHPSDHKRLKNFVPNAQQDLTHCMGQIIQGKKPEDF